MWLSKDGIESMGFSEIPVRTQIEAIFNSILVYSIEGLILEGLSSESFSDRSYKGDGFAIAFGNSINEITKSLLGDDLTDNEAEWIKENNANPPFLVLHIYLKEPSICNSGYWKKDGEILSTYDSFSGANQLLKNAEQETIPGLISSLTIHFSKLHNPLRFKRVDRVVFGKTPAGGTVIDSKINVSARGFTSKSIKPEDIKGKLHASVKDFGSVDPKVSALFHSGLEEQDRFKQFFNFYQTLEIHTHQVFKKTDFRLFSNQFNLFPDRLKLSVKSFLLDKQMESKNLRDRFMWCAIFVWDSLDDSDIEDFKTAKKIRDELSHGEQIPTSKLPNEKLEKILLKLL